MKKIRILELTNFSAGGCGVWQRAKQESLELSRRGYEVRVFSSNATKGSNDIAPENDFLEGIKIKRFSFKKLGGESFMLWNFEKEALDFKPDVIIAHSYRHSHTGKALKLAEKIRKNGGKCKVFLVTHAPFIEGNKTRSLLASLIVNSYDFFLGHKLNKFDKVIAITRWEMPILLKLGLKKDKIAYIPNGLPQEFFSKPKKGKGILFLGRISPVKNLEVLLMAVKNLKIQLDLVGPAEREYQEKLSKLVRDNRISNVKFLPPIYELKQKIELIDRHGIFVLPSKTEAMPQSLIEAMARGKLVISSNTPGGREIIGKKTGFLFEIGNVNQLINLIEKIQNMPQKEKDKMGKAARKSAEKFNWNILINSLIKIF